MMRGAPQKEGLMRIRTMIAVLGSFALLAGMTVPAAAQKVVEQWNRAA